MYRNIAPAEFYRIPAWGGGFFDVDSKGRVAVLFGEEPHQTQVPLVHVVETANKSGLSLPLLIRFPHVLQMRALRLHNAFHSAKREFHYQGDYYPVYPIKVNQQRSVIEELLASDETLGLEAGSKPELLAVLSLIGQNSRRPIICNGYKDEDIIKLAFLGQNMGHSVVIVIEKLAELPIILSQLGMQEKIPVLGLRIRLATLGNGNWQNTGGEKSKFGLLSHEVLALIQTLKERGLLQRLQLLHCHLGSQIPDIEDLRKGISECTRFFVELRKLGAPISTVDVGGGVGIDYEGKESNRDSYSVNYGFLEYARCVVQTLKEGCITADLPHPHIMTESGRAMTAHHAVLVTQVVHCEQPSFAQKPLLQNASTHPFFQTLYKACAVLSPATARETYHQAKYIFSAALSGYLQGALSLADRAAIEQLVCQLYHQVYEMLQAVPSSDLPDFLPELTEKLARKLVCNFSVFQSIPDVWGLDQTFPILPLSGLLETTLWPTVIEDITCDSDGRVDHYVSKSPYKTILPMPTSLIEKEFLIGFFLVGAYQEILGDIHNLFGDTHSVHVIPDEKKSFKLVSPLSGDTVASILQSVHICPEAVRDILQKKINNGGIRIEQKTNISVWLNEMLLGSTYLR